MLTNKGMEMMLKGTSTPNGSIANIATALRLYTNATTPLKTGSGFTEVTDGNGYTAGGIAITTADWTYTFSDPNGFLQLADKTWTASGGNIANVAGAYVVNAAGLPLAWWPRDSGVVTQAPPDQIIADDLIVQLT